METVALDFSSLIDLVTWNFILALRLCERRECFGP